jgi:hypothetical protein
MARLTVVREGPRGRPFQPVPGSLRSRVLAAVPFEGSKNARTLLDEFGGAERNKRTRVCTCLQNLVEDGLLEVIGQEPREGRYGRAPRLFRRVVEPQTNDRRRFARAKAIVEAAGFIVIPKRPLPVQERKAA